MCIEKNMHATLNNQMLIYFQISDIKKKNPKKLYIYGNLHNSLLFREIILHIDLFTLV